MNASATCGQRLDDAEIQAARDADVRDVWKRLGLPELPPNGGNVSSPWRDDPGPSLHVGGTKNVVHDYGTGKTLDSIALVQRARGCGFAEAVTWINGGHSMPQAPARASRPKGKPGPAPILPVPDDAPAPPAEHFEHGRPSRRWTYHDAQGRTLGFDDRFDKPDGGKDVLPLTFCRMPDGSLAWRWKSFPEPRPLYGLDQLAARPDAPVIWHEGGKASDGGAGMFPDFVSVASPGGAGAVGKADYRPLKGRRVWVWGDNDAPGRKAAQDVARLALAAGAAEVHVVDVPRDFPDGWDLADIPPTSWDAARLRELLNAAPIWKPTNSTTAAASNVSANTSMRPRYFSARDLATREIPAIQWAVNGLLPEGQGVLAGRPKSGKSWASIQLAVDVAQGTRTLGRFNAIQGDVLLIALEDSQARLQRRLTTILGDAPIPERLTITTEFPFLGNAGMGELKTWFDEHPATRLVIIDTLPKIAPSRGRDQDEYEHAYRIASALQKLAMERHACILCVLHTRKSSDSDIFTTVMGSTGWTAAADSILVLTRKRGKEARAELHVTGRDMDEAAYEMQAHGGVWTVTGELDQSEETKAERAAEWIRSYLTDGPRPAKDVFREGRAAGHADSAIREGKTIAGAESIKVGFNPTVWHWELNPHLRLKTGPKGDVSLIDNRRRISNEIFDKNAHEAHEDAPPSSAPSGFREDDPRRTKMTPQIDAQVQQISEGAEDDPLSVNLTEGEVKASWTA
jgi:hypothetical protein